MESSADTHTPTAGAPSAHAEYTTRLASLSAQQSREQRRERLLGYSKLALAAFVVIAAGFLIHHVRGLLMLLIPIAAFIVLAILQEKLIASIRVRTRAIRFYERGLARLEDRWSGGGETGDRFLDPAHPYARDLDLFGVGSLFDYLCTARTRTGEESLARWLLAAAPPAEILDRQAAVRELAPRLDLREQLYSSGESVRNAVDPAALAAWGESNPVLTSAATRIVSSILAILWLLSIPAWLLWDAPAPFFLISIANFAWAHQIHARLERAAAGIEKSAAHRRRAPAPAILDPRRRRRAIRRDPHPRAPRRNHRIAPQPLRAPVRPRHLLERATHLPRRAVAAQTRPQPSRLARRGRRTRSARLVIRLRIRPPQLRIPGIDLPKARRIRSAVHSPGPCPSAPADDQRSRKRSRPRRFHPTHDPQRPQHGRQKHLHPLRRHQRRSCPVRSARPRA